MATRRSNNGTPENPPAAARRAGGTSWIKTHTVRVNRNLRRRIQRLGNAHIDRVGGRYRTTVEFYGLRDETLHEAQDFLVEYEPPGLTFASITPEGQHPFTTILGPWQVTYRELEGRAIWYLETKREKGYDSIITVQVIILT